MRHIHTYLRFHVHIIYWLEYTMSNYTMYLIRLRTRKTRRGGMRYFTVHIPDPWWRTRISWSRSWCTVFVARNSVVMDEVFVRVFVSLVLIRPQASNSIQFDLFLLVILLKKWRQWGRRSSTTFYLGSTCLTCRNLWFGPPLPTYHHHHTKASQPGASCRT